MPKCLECNVEKKLLPAHLRIKHDMSVAEYQEKFKDHTIDLGVVKYTPATKPVPNSDSMTRGLTPPEQDFYADRYKTLWENSNEDPVYAAPIAQVVMNEIFIRRYQLQSQQLYGKTGTSAKDLGELHRMIDGMQKQTLDMLKSLNLTKEKRDALNKSPESTPSRMVTSLALVCANMTPTEAKKNEKDIEEAITRLREHTDELLHIAPIDAESTSVDTVEIG